MRFAQAAGPGLCRDGRMPANKKRPAVRRGPPGAAEAEVIPTDSIPDSGSLGLATVPTEPGGAPGWLSGADDVDGMQFTLLEVGLRWPKSGRPETDKTFVLLEPTPQIERKARSRAGVKAGQADIGNLIDTLLESVIYSIGGKRTMSNHDLIQKWLTDIGPKGRMCLQNAYGELASVEDEATEAFLATGRLPGGLSA